MGQVFRQLTRRSATGRAGVGPVAIQPKLVDRPSRQPVEESNRHKDTDDPQVSFASGPLEPRQAYAEQISRYDDGWGGNPRRLFT